MVAAWQITVTINVGSSAVHIQLESVVFSPIGGPFVSVPLSCPRTCHYSSETSILTSTKIHYQACPAGFPFRLDRLVYVSERNLWYSVKVPVRKSPSGVFRLESNLRCGNFMTLASNVHRPVFEHALGYLSGQTRCVKIKLKVENFRCCN